MAPAVFLFFFFNDTATTEIYTLSLHDALPISDYDDPTDENQQPQHRAAEGRRHRASEQLDRCGGRKRYYKRKDRKSTRLNSSHANISYAVFCLKKKNSA